MKCKTAIPHDIRNEFQKTPGFHSIIVSLFICRYA